MRRVDLFPRGFIQDLDQLFGSTNPRVLPYHIFEKENSYQISVDLPGVVKQDLDIEIEGDLLGIKAVRKNELGEEYAKFDKKFKLPVDADKEKIEAAYENGVLKVAVPKAGANTNTRKIPIGEKVGESCC